MSSPLNELKNIVQSPDIFKIGVLMENSIVSLPNGATISSWGTAKIGDTVLLKGKQIVSVVKKTETVIKYIR